MVSVQDLFASDPPALRGEWLAQPDGGADLDPAWQAVLRQFWGAPQGQQLQAFLSDRYRSGAVIYPPDPYAALRQTPLHAVRVVILGQDPYHGPGQAHGLSFSVPAGVAIPRSLRNIHKEVARDVGLPAPAHGSLLAWAQQGVLLLNTSLTVEDGQPASHAKKGWEVLTDALLAEVATHASPCVYMLWGGHAQAKRELIEAAARMHQIDALVLVSNHPSPLSATRGPLPFMGCAHFSQARAWLGARGVALDWGYEAAERPG